MAGYEPKEIERKWQTVWAEEKTWEVANPGQPGFDSEKPKAYVLEMLPYPSGEPHVGHLKCYAVGDAIAHFRRRHGFEVIHPMGYDSFGLPAENNAIKTGEPPRVATERSIESFRRQFREWGISIDWSRELATHTPEYYRWTQWIFLQLFERGLAYRTEAPVQWCPKDATVLANEQVVDGRCERCGTEVIQRNLEQWFFRITEYADRLLEDFELLESWPEHVITMQRNWIGRSEGAEVVFRCEEVGLDFPVFTTRPDTLFGATFFVLAPEHPELMRLVEDTPAAGEVREYVNRVGRESAEERGAEDREKTGVPLGRSVVNPVNGEEIPMFVADYVLMEYGTGAIMAVPGHDSRDYEFAQKFGLPVKRVIEGEDPEAARDDDGLPYPGDGAMVNSGRFDGRHNREAYEEIVAAANRRSTTACGTGWSAASATGGRRSRSSTARSAGSCPCPRTSCRSSCRRSRTTRRRARARWPRPRTGSRPSARAAAPPPAARPTRWTPSSTPPGTSSATWMRATTGRRGIGKPQTLGCRWTSTSAESSTRSCT
jgi:leucyl-tRNA synthetase